MAKMQISNAPKILFVRLVSKNLFVISKREVIVLVLDHNKKKSYLPISRPTHLNQCIILIANKINKRGQCYFHLVHNVNAPLPAQYKIARKKNVEKKRERERERERESPTFRIPTKMQEIFRPIICCKKLQTLSNPIFRASLKFKLQQEIIEKEMVWHQLHKILLSLPYP
jgi:hypothetical protein